MGNMKTQCFHDRLAFLKVGNIILINVLGEKLTFPLQFQHFVHGFFDFFPAIV